MRVRYVGSARLAALVFALSICFAALVSPSLLFVLESPSADFASRLGFSPRATEPALSLLCAAANATPLCTATRHLPRLTVARWRERDFLIVLGIASEDRPERRRRRDLQRTTCWRYPDVATRANAHRGSMLVLYFFGRHPMHGGVYSDALVQEARQWRDVITLDTNEGRHTQVKEIGKAGFWGMEAAVALAKKVYFWYRFAVCAFPRAQYLAKGDDDMFLRVPQFLFDLASLPRKGIYWGRLVPDSAVVHNRTVPFFYAGGPCATLARDLAVRLASYEPLQRLVRLPYMGEGAKEFKSLSMRHEDQMVGHVLMEAVGAELVYVREASCRFHDVHNGRPVPLTKDSVMIHHVKEGDYDALKRHVRDDAVVTPRRSYTSTYRIIEFTCK